VRESWSQNILTTNGRGRTAWRHARTTQLHRIELMDESPKHKQIPIVKCSSLIVLHAVPYVCAVIERTRAQYRRHYAQYVGHFMREGLKVKHLSSDHVVHPGQKEVFIRNWPAANLNLKQTRPPQLLLKTAPAAIHCLEPLQWRPNGQTGQLQVHVAAERSRPKSEHISSSIRRVVYNLNGFFV
jgi:hypothetical protein